jgi:hypothetical protein
MKRALLIALATLTPLTAAAQATTDKAQVVTAVQQFFDSMATRDVEQAKRVLIPEGRFFSTREENGQIQSRSFTAQEYLTGLPTRKEAAVERMWDPDVRIHGAIAVLWTRYDFYRDGKFSHCGIDSFDLIKTADGWKIAGGVYTIERTGCPESPLGPPK